MGEIQSRCGECGAVNGLPLLWCSQCGGLILIPPIQGPSMSEVQLNSMWDLQGFLPHFDHPISLVEGATPTSPVRNINSLYGLNLKLEFRNPTGSFRDRASSLLITDALQKMKSLLIAADTGSFSISLAAYAAHAGMHMKNVVPLNLEL